MLRFILKSFLLSLCAVFVIPELVRYDGYYIYQITLEHSNHIKILSELKERHDGIILWSTLSSINKPVFALVAPKSQEFFLNSLKTNHISGMLIEDNFQRILDLEQNELRRRSNTYDWTGYRTLNETYHWLQSLVGKYPDRVTSLIGGQTYEGRQIRGVKISFDEGNRGIFLEAGIHACEWISPATVTFILNEILTSTDPEIRSLVEKFDWYVFPHFNPDGYEYTHTTNRLWRKTRSNGSKCDGADPNRNWGFRWMEAGASLEECSNNYAGKEAFSETETKTLSEFLLTLKDKIHTYVAFHSYGQVLVHPYAAIEERVPNYEDLEQIGNATIKRLAQRYGTEYEVGSVYDIIYPAAGSSPDWVYGVLQVPVVFTYELRPYSSPNGFVLPSSNILPSGKETFESLIAMIIEATKLGYYK